MNVKVNIVKTSVGILSVVKRNVKRDIYMSAGMRCRFRKNKSAYTCTLQMQLMMVRFKHSRSSLLI